MYALVALGYAFPTRIGRNLGRTEVRSLILKDSEPYMRTGSTQHSTLLRDERGLSKPWKAPNWTCEEKCRPSFIYSFMYRQLAGGERVPPRHLPDLCLGRHVSPILILRLVEGMLLLFVAESSLVLMSSAWANAPRNRPFTLKPRFLCFKLDNRRLMMRLNSKGERTEPRQIPQGILKDRHDFPTSLGWQDHSTNFW